MGEVVTSCAFLYKDKWKKTRKFKHMLTAIVHLKQQNGDGNIT